MYGEAISHSPITISATSSQRCSATYCKLGEAEYQDADRKRIQDHEAAFRIDKFMACLGGKPRRQHDQHAKQHAAPVFPCSMSAEETESPTW